MKKININVKNLFGYIPHFIRFFPQIFKYMALDFIIILLFAIALPFFKVKEIPAGHELTFVLALLAAIILFLVFLIRLFFIKLNGSFLIFKKMLLDEPVDYSEIDKIIKAKIGKIITYCFCYVGFCVLISIPFLLGYIFVKNLSNPMLIIITMILAVVVAITIFVFLIVRYFSFSFEILIIEDIPVMQTFEKSSQVAKENVWAFLIIFILQNLFAGLLHLIPTAGVHLSSLGGFFFVYGYIYLYLIANGQIENA